MKIEGKIIFVKVVPFSDAFDKEVPEHHRLQIQSLDPEQGYVIHDVKDKDKKYSEKDIGKDLSFAVSLYSKTPVYMTLV